MPGLLPLRRPSGSRSGLFARLINYLHVQTGLRRYRPERHYMRGGRTHGSRASAGSRRATPA